MKKLIVLFIAVMVMAGALTACKDANPSEPLTVGTEAKSSVSTSEEASNEGSAETDTQTAGNKEDKSDASQGENVTEPSEKKLADNENFSITITSCVTDESKGFAMYAELENKTVNPLLFKVTASALNNKDMHPEFTLEVPAKEKVNAPMIWSADKLAERRLVEVTEVKIELEVISYGAEVEKLSNEIYVINP